MCDPILLDRGLDALGLTLSPQVRESILIYCRELLKWNRRINLVARQTTESEALEKHFLDSLTLVPLIRQYGRSPKSLLDVGTGAGFPGLVLAVALQDLRVTLVEPRQKRVSFLRHCIRTLGLTNVELIAGRLEQAGCEDRFFTFITSRAVAEAGRFAAMVREVAAPQSLLLVMQGAEGLAEDAAPCRKQGWRLLESRQLHLPFSRVPRHLSVLARRAGEPVTGPGSGEKNP